MITKSQFVQIVVCEGQSTLPSYNTATDDLINIIRLTEWDSADIVIRLSGRNETLKSTSNPKPVTYGRTNGSRQSKRLRQNKEYKQRRVITVSKSTTVKDIKIMVCPIPYQLAWYLNESFRLTDPRGAVHSNDLSTLNLSRKRARRQRCHSWYPGTSRQRYS